MKKGKNITKAGAASIEEMENACMKEVTEVLKKHDCSLRVNFRIDSVMGEEVLRYQILFQKNGQKS